MMIVVKRDSPTWRAASGDDEDIVIEALRDLARWLYRQLEVEHDFRSAQPQVDEAIRANGFTFTETGRRFG
jgi:transposase